MVCLIRTGLRRSMKHWLKRESSFLFESVSSGYPLDSACPNSLWLGAHLDQRLISSRRSVDGLLHEPEKQFPAALRSPAVEAEWELVKVVWHLPGSHRALVGSEQPSLQQRGNSVYPPYEVGSVFASCHR